MLWELCHYGWWVRTLATPPTSLSEDYEARKKRVSPVDLPRKVMIVHSPSSLLFFWSTKLFTKVLSTASLNLERSSSSEESDMVCSVTDEFYRWKERKKIKKLQKNWIKTKQNRTCGSDITKAFAKNDRHSVFCSRQKILMGPECRLYEINVMFVLYVTATVCLCWMDFTQYLESSLPTDLCKYVEKRQTSADRSLLADCCQCQKI